MNFRRIQNIDNRREAGFSLIEIMVVVGITVLLMSLSLPQFIRSRVNANEAATISNMRLIVAVSHAYYGKQLPHTFPTQLSDLGAPTSVPPYIDALLASGTKQGYNFVYNSADVNTFTMQVNPTSFISGSRYFFVDQTGVMKVSDDGDAAVVGDPVL